MISKDVKDRIHASVIKELDPAVLDGQADDAVREAVCVLASEILTLRGEEASKENLDCLLDEILGYGPITGLLDDAEITEVMVNGPHVVYYEKGGKIYPANTKFDDDEHVLRIIEKIVAPIGRRIDEATPMVDARLPDGSRVNAIIDPLSLIGPVLTIRKFAVDPYTIGDLISFGTVTAQMADFLSACVQARLNIIVSGGTGSGKTTTLNVLSGFIPSDERIVTIEDAAELQLKQRHVIPLESRPANMEGKGQGAIRDLVKNCLRMRPDRIVVGECRSAEALDMLQAMNTGHDGGLTTCHSNSPRDTLSRIETMVLMTGMDIPTRAIREQMASAIDMIVHQERLKDGSRRVTHVTEIAGTESGMILLQDIFLFKQEGVTQTGEVVGKHVPTGVIPRFVDEIEAKGMNIPRQIFRDEEMWK